MAGHCHSFFRRADDEIENPEETTARSARELIDRGPFFLTKGGKIEGGKKKKTVPLLNLNKY